MRAGRLGRERERSFAKVASAVHAVHEILRISLLKTDCVFTAPLTLPFMVRNVPPHTAGQP